MPDEAEISSVCSTIGESAIGRVVAEFYRRVPSDDVLGPMYPPDDLAEAESRLREFLVYRFGGSDQYLQQPRAPATANPACSVLAHTTGSRSLGHLDGSVAFRSRTATSGRDHHARLPASDGHVSDQLVTSPRANFKARTRRLLET